MRPAARGLAEYVVTTTSLHRYHHLRAWKHGPAWTCAVTWPRTPVPISTVLRSEYSFAEWMQYPASEEVDGQIRDRQAAAGFIPNGRNTYGRPTGSTLCDGTN